MAVVRSSDPYDGAAGLIASDPVHDSTGQDLHDEQLERITSPLRTSPSVEVTIQNA